MVETVVAAPEPVLETTLTVESLEVVLGAESMLDSPDVVGAVELDVESLPATNQQVSLSALIPEPGSKSS